MENISCSAAHPTEICELNFFAEHQVSLPGKSDVGVVDNCWYVDVQIRVLYSCGANVFPPHVANHSGHCAVERTVEQSRVQQQNRAATEKQQQRAEWRCWRHWGSANVRSPMCGRTCHQIRATKYATQCTRRVPHATNPPTTHLKIWIHLTT